MEDNTGNNNSYKTITVTAGENSNFKGTKELTVIVISKAEVSFQDKDGKPIKSIQYTGDYIAGDDIKVVVTYNVGTQTVLLYEGKDYTVRFVNNVNKGRATVVITGMPNQSQYIGSKTATFSIVANNLKNLL